jgi:GTP-binding protein Era
MGKGQNIMSEDSNRRCGHAALIGAPNAGKSTLINYLVGQKIAITSPKPQTTVTRTLGIALEGEAQIILIDTPGIFTASKTRNAQKDRAMLRTAWDSAAEADVILLIVDSRKTQPDPGTEAILEKLRQDKPVWLVLNKVDGLNNKASLLTATQALHARREFAETFMVSAQTGEGVKELITRLAAMMPPGEWQYGEDDVTDVPERELAAEITREQLYRQLEEELPYAARVVTEQWETFDNGDIKITQSVLVEKDGQKAIIIGKGGSRLKEIGEEARQEMARVFGCKKVHLFLHVKTEK